MGGAPARSRARYRSLARYHQHGGYLLANADLPGFVRLEQKLLSALVAFHRRKIEDPFLADLPATWRVPMFKLIVLLRLAVLLNRTRSPVELPHVALSPGNDLLELRFPGWLAEPTLPWRSAARTGVAQSPRVRAACGRDFLAAILDRGIPAIHRRHDASASSRRRRSCAARGSSPLCAASCVYSPSAQAPTPARCRLDTSRSAMSRAFRALA